MKLLHHIRQHSDGLTTKCSTDLLPLNYMQGNEIMHKTYYNPTGLKKIDEFTLLN